MFAYHPADSENEYMGKINIILPKHRIVRDHELNAASILVAKFGGVIRFLSESNYSTPDIEWMGEYWEIKSPIGDSSRTIENTVRKAMTQSRNIIIDLSRNKNNKDKLIRDIRKQVNLSGKKIRKMIVIIDENNTLVVK